MNRYEQTSLWQQTFGRKIEPDLFRDNRDFLRVQFENFRSRAKVLAGEISNVLPEYTVHDIEHIDALWETADIVIQKENFLNPAEAFVLGGAFLIHDLGMGLASFPNGIKEIKDELLWKDTVISIMREKYNKNVKLSDLDLIDIDVEKEATETVLRMLHAKHAEKLALVSWKDKSGSDVFLLENTELREAYGHIIGLIAHSHWWSVTKLEEKLPAKLGAPGILPNEWTIDVIKLACILRIADAIQIDDRRAPSFLMTIRKPSTHSSLHWNFQNKLYQPRLDRSRLVYTSKAPFSLSEIESWWICFDSLKMIDNELKEVDSLLIDKNIPRLNATGVASIENPSRLAKLITVDGWHPIDTQIKVSNVAKLVGTLGGKQLYGDDLVVPLRELIQNASDAVRARRVIEQETDDFGSVVIEFGSDELGDFIEIEDNGIGMSQRVLTGPFLDFGNSFWGSSLMHEELPGLEARGFSSTGKYGIGFYSVFMWGNKVSVSSRRFEAGRDSTLVLEFNNGTISRPVLRKASTEEVVKDGGTRIKIWFTKRRILNKIMGEFDNKVSTSELIENLCPSLDCNVYLKEDGKKKRIIKANDWIKISPIELIKRTIGARKFRLFSDETKEKLEKLSNNMTTIVEDGVTVGRLLLYTEGRVNTEIVCEGVVTIGGMKSSGLTGLLGVLVGVSSRASRDIGTPIVSDETISKWASEQSELLFRHNLPIDTQLECAQLIRACKGDTGELLALNFENEYMSTREFKNRVVRKKFEEFLVVQDAAISNYERDNNCNIVLYDNVVTVACGTPGVLQTRSIESFVTWPRGWREERFDDRSLRGVVDEVLSEVYCIELCEMLEQSDISTDDRSIKGVVGTVEEKEVSIDHLDIIKVKKTTKG